MSAPHPIFDQLGRDFDKHLAPAQEPEQDEPADPIAVVYCCLAWCGLLALGAAFVTGERAWAVAALAVLVIGYLTACRWPERTP